MQIIVKENPQNEEWVSSQLCVAKLYNKYEIPKWITYERRVSVVWAFFFFFLAHFSACGPGVLVLVTKVFWHNIILLNSSRQKKERKSTLRRNFHLILVIMLCRIAG